MDNKCRPNVDPAETKGREWCKYAVEAVGHVCGSTGGRAPLRTAPHRDLGRRNAGEGFQMA